MRLLTKFSLGIAVVVAPLAVAVGWGHAHQHAHALPDDHVSDLVLWIAVACLVVLGAVSAAVWWLACAPARRIGREMLRVAERGAYDQPLTTDAARGDEFGDCARAFNRVLVAVRDSVAALYDANAQLERRVADRTAELAGERDFTAAVLNTADALVCVVDRDGRVVRFNGACERLTGHAAAEVCGRTFADLFVPADEAAGARAAFARLAGGEFPIRHESDWLTKSGERRRVAWANTCLLGPDGTVAHVIGTGVDVTDRRASEQLDRDRTGVLEMIAHGCPLGETLGRVVELVERQRPGAWAAVMRLHEFELHVAAGPSLPPTWLDHLRGGLPLGPEAGPSAQAVLDGAPVCCADVTTHPAGWAKFRAAAGEHGVRAAWAVPMLSGAGEVLGTVTVYAPVPRDATPADLELLSAAASLAAVAIERQDLTDRLAHQAQHDPLTGLPNRLVLEDRLQRSLGRACADESEVAVMLIDVDGFKAVNDTLGHQRGDLLLQLVAQRLSAVVRPGDTLVRTGGDEFSLVAPDVGGRDGAAAVAGRLVEALRPPLELDGQAFYCTASVGVSVYPADGDDAAALQRHADAALYKAKASGRDRFALFDSELSSAVAERLELETALRRAMDAGEFELHYQPKVDPDGRVTGVEALVRWRHPTRGLVPPGRFIPLAEESGLIVPLGTWVLRESCRQAAAWARAMPRPPRVALNVSALQFAQSDFVDTVAAAVRDAGVDPGLIELELTESLLMQHTQPVAEKLARVRAMGIGLAIDDFGTGYSSLAYLHRLPIHTLKIDRSFVLGLAPGDDAADRADRTAVIRAITSLAHSLQLRLVAEGVETEPQRRFLLGVGCHEFQGFLFSPARPADEIEPILRHGWDHADERVKRPA